MFTCDEYYRVEELQRRCSRLDRMQLKHIKISVWICFEYFDSLTKKQTNIETMQGSDAKQNGRTRLAPFEIIRDISEFSIIILS